MRDPLTVVDDKVRLAVRFKRVVMIEILVQCRRRRDDVQPHGCTTFECLNAMVSG